MEPVKPSLSPDAFTGLHIPAFIDGADCTLTSTFEVTSPYTGQTAWKSSSATAADAIRAVEAARVAFENWSRTKPSNRRDLLLRAAQLMEDRTEQIAECMRTEMGASVGATSGFIVPGAVGMVRDCAARTSAIQGWVPEVDMEGQSAIVKQIPIGVVLGIVPWNAPPVFGARSIATALAAGCTTVIKATELTPRTYHMVAKCFHDAGLPGGVLSVISCQPSDAAEVVNAMIAHPAVRKVNFTGSTAVGRKVAVECARHLKPSVLELGGKNSALVMADANLEQAALQCILGGMLNSGQICMSTDRIIVDRSVASAFQETLKGILGNMFTAKNPAPTLVNAASKTRIDAVIAEAQNQGAHILEGGWCDPPSNGNTSDMSNGATNGSHHSQQQHGVFLRPIVLSNVTPEMKVWQDEMFGSVVAITPADTEDEMVEMANATGYGLSASVFTTDLQRGLSVAKRIEAGAVHINSMTVHDEPALPFGGVKASGWGRFNGVRGLEEFLVTKSITWMD